MTVVLNKFIIIAWGNLGRLEVRSGEHKAAISLKRVKIEEKLLWTAYIETHQRFFERYHSRPSMASPFSRLGVCNLATPYYLRNG